MILGGDITGKTITPIIQTPEGGWRVKCLGEVIEVRNPKRLKEVVGRIGEVGSYPLVLTAKEYEDFQNDPAGVTAVFDRLMHDSVVRWVRLAEERLRGKDVEIFVQPGNDDTYAIDDALRGSDVVVNPDGKVLEIAGGHEMLSLGLANMTPWQCPRDVPEEDLEARLARLGDLIRRPESLRSPLRHDRDFGAFSIASRRVATWRDTRSTSAGWRSPASPYRPDADRTASRLAVPSFQKPQSSARVSVIRAIPIPRAASLGEGSFSRRSNTTSLRSFSVI